MKKTISVICLLLSFALYGQESIDTTYYKDFYLLREVSNPQRARYIKIESKKEGILTTKVIQVSNNIVVKIRSYKDGKPTGTWKVFNGKGKIENERDFKEIVYLGKPHKNQYKEGDYEVATFGHDENDIFKYLTNNIKYPRKAKEDGIGGKVYIQLKIDKEGKVTPIAVIRSVHFLLDYEAWRVFKKMPNWNPAKKDGEPIDSYCVFPISFTVM